LFFFFVVFSLSSYPYFFLFFIIFFIIFFLLLFLLFLVPQLHARTHARTHAHTQAHTYPECSSSDYRLSLVMAGIDTLKERTEALSERFFKKQVLPSK